MEKTLWRPTVIYSLCSSRDITDKITVGGLVSSYSSRQISVVFPSAFATVSGSLFEEGARKSFDYWEKINTFRLPYISYRLDDGVTGTRTVTTNALKYLELWSLIVIVTGSDDAHTTNNIVRYSNIIASSTHVYLVIIISTNNNNLYGVKLKRREYLSLFVRYSPRIIVRSIDPVFGQFSYSFRKTGAVFNRSTVVKRTRASP